MTTRPNRAPRALLEKVNHVVRLIRSKGVSVFFVTQNPQDVPDSVLSQLGNRVQHALRAYTLREVRAVKTAADTFRPNPEFSAFEVITQLGVGEALVSTLEAKGIPSMVQRTLIRPPSSRIGTLDGAERRRLLAASPIGKLYDRPVDRRSAFEVLQRRVETKAKADPIKTRGNRRDDSIGAALDDLIGDAAEKLGRTIGGPAAGRVGRSIIRGILGGILRN